MPHSSISLASPLAALLRRNVSRAQTIGYALATFTGLSIVLVAMQFYRDMHHAWDSRDSLMGENYMVLSKTVSGLGGVFGSKADFSIKEIADISRQPWAVKTGVFTAADFDVFASVEIGGGRMSTSLFLEAVPDEFFDVMPREWSRGPGEGEPLPIIIPKDYLALYNFGYAASRGLPQLSESMMGMLPLRLSLSGNGRQEWVDARIVGFSSRLNTIAVPLRFLENANARFGKGEINAPGRVIVKVTDPGDPAIKRYLSEHRLEAGGNGTDSGNLNHFLAIVTTVVISVGFIITLLSFFILLLSIYLLLQKNRAKIHDLMLLGYRPGAITRVYGTMVVWLNLIVTALSVVAVIGAQLLWKSPLQAIGVTTSSPALTILTAIGAFLLITLLDLLAIRHQVRTAFRQ